MLRLGQNNLQTNYGCWGSLNKLLQKQKFEDTTRLFSNRWCSGRKKDKKTKYYKEN